jgi:phosphomannomutase
MQVKLQPGGLRGKVGRGLDLGQVIDLVSAFGSWLGGEPVLVTRDTRPSSPMLAHAVLASLSAAGCEALDAGICPTAVAVHEAARLGVSGVVSVTASHNDALWNGLKLYGQSGRALSAREGEEVLDLFHQGEFAKARFDRLGATRLLDDVSDRYVEDLSRWVDRERIARARLRVVIDTCAGSAAMVIPQLCRALGVDLIPLGGEPSGVFAHPPDPTARNLAAVAAIVRPVQARAGFGLSSDGERVSFVGAAGFAPGSEATLPLLAEALDGQAAQGPIVAAVTCDSRIDHVAARRGIELVRCGVGATAVLERMAETGAALGGESSGGVALAGFQLAFDGIAAIARMLECLAAGQELEELHARLPVTHVRSLAIPVGLSQAYAALARLREAAEGEVNELDGLRVSVPGGWTFVRVSGTEPVIRVLCEADSEERADDLIRRLGRAIRNQDGELA